MAAIDFARAEPFKFLGVVICIIAVIGTAAYLLRMLLPYKIFTKAEEFTHLRLAAQRKIAEAIKSANRPGE